MVERFFRDITTERLRNGVFRSVPELIAAIKRLPAPSDKVEAIVKAKFAGEVEICWFLTISFEYDIEYREELSI